MASSARSDGACLARRPCSQRRSHRSGFLTLRSVLWLILFVTGSTSTEHRKLGSVMCNIRASRQRAGAQTREPRPLGLDSRAHRSLKCEKSTCMSTKMARRRHQTLSRGVLLCGCRHLRGKSPAPLLSFEFTQEGYVAYSTHTDRRARVKLAEGRLVLFDSAQRYALATLVVRNGARPGNVKQQWPQRLRQDDSRTHQDQHLFRHCFWSQQLGGQNFPLLSNQTHPTANLLSPSMGSYSEDA